MFARLVTFALALGAASAFMPAPSHSPRTVLAAAETKDDLVTLSEKLNPAVKFFDPLSLADAEFWGDSNEATIGFLRHAEIKHGRIAMFAFVGFCAQSNGVRWAWPMTTAGDSFPDLASPGAQWDAIPSVAKWQILSAIAIFELWGEGALATHYMRGGKPGVFPSFKGDGADGMKLPHPVPFDLFDPFGFSKKASDEKKASGLIKEINNGRLAQIGIMGFLAESKVDGAVPALAGKIAHYDGDYMAPFEANFHTFLQSS